MLTKEDLKYCLQHYPEIAEHIKTVAKERYRLLKKHEQSAGRLDVMEENYSNKPDQPNQSQNDDQDQSCFIINPESYFGLTISAIGHVLVLLTSLILPYQVIQIYVLVK